MGLISVTLPVDGTTADVADVNVPFTTIVTLVNGNLDNANISSVAAIDGTKLATNSVTANQINFGGAGTGVWWKEIGRTTLSTAGDTISVTGLSAFTYLKVMTTGLASGLIDMLIRFNNDSGNNYSYRYGLNDASTGSAASTNLLVGTTALAGDHYAEFYITNITAKEKMVIGQSVNTNTTGAANIANYFVMSGKWANTAAQISRIDIINDQTGDFAIGSELIVLGHN